MTRVTECASTWKAGHHDAITDVRRCSTPLLAATTTTGFHGRTGPAIPADLQLDALATPAAGRR
ncbi:hypothetical protein ACIF9R_13950 [Streptomyces sp. NPDC086080]|uniref:hypothetical protein n=1 Tax=Streptomyces sp. NPDC086080 TaxID=3365748 RepID=UPI0037D6F24D